MTNYFDKETAMNAFTNRRIKLLSAFATATLLAACGGGGGGEAGPSTPVLGQNGSVDVNTVTMDAGQTCNIARFPQELLAHINAVRAAGQNCGGTVMAPAGPLTWNSLITQAAAKHSVDMANNNFYSHTGTDGGGVFDRFAAVGYKFNDAGEILLAGTTKIPNAMNSFLASPSHCTYLMRPDFKEVGGACASSASSQFKHYLTVNFGS